MNCGKNSGENVNWSNPKISEPSSEIAIELSTTARETVVVAVPNQTDHVSPAELAKLFEKFYGRDKSRSNATSGSGIGLAVVQRIVELHQGKIWAESHDHRLTVYVELPLHQG